MTYLLAKVNGEVQNLLFKKQGVKQAIINTVTNTLIYAISILVNFWFTPFLIKNLGVNVYGLIPLASSVTSYLGLITLGLTAGVGRFLTVELEHKDGQLANKTFNTSFWGLVGLSFVLSCLGGIIVLLVPYMFHVPAGEENSSQWLFVFVITSFVITTVGSSFAVSSFARNRLDLKNCFRLGDQAIRVFFVIFLFSSFSPKVWQVGLGIVCATAFSFFGDVYLWKKLTPELSLSVNYFDSRKIKELFSFGGWQVVNIIGALLFLNIDLIVINIFVGTKASGEFGAILLFSTALRTLASTISSGISPYLVKKVARKEFKVVNKISIVMVKYFGLFLGFPIGILCGLATPLLTLWLGEDFAHLSFVFILIMFHLPINLAVVPLFDLQLTFGKVKWPGIVTLSMGILDLVLDIIFAIKWGVVGVAVADAIALTIKNMIFTTLYGAHIQKTPRLAFIKALLPGVAGEVLCFSLGVFVNLQFSITSWSALLLASGSIGIVYAILVSLLFVRDYSAKFDFVAVK